MNGLDITKPSLSEDADVIWELVAPALIADGRLAPGDELMFAEYCELQAMAEEAKLRVRAEGMMIGGAGTGSKTQKNPAFNVWREASGAARQLATQFGIGPKSRKQLGIKRTGLGGARAVRDVLGDRK